MTKVFCVYKIMEIWKDIKGYDGLYQISNTGRVLSFHNNIVLKSVHGTDGYLKVNLYANGKRRTERVHKLVAIAFLDHQPSGYKTVVDHKDNNPLNNRFDNLQLITNRQNTSKDKKSGTSKYTGVSWDKLKNKWVSRISIKGKYRFLGYFTYELEASKAYQTALKQL